MQPWLWGKGQRVNGGLEKVEEREGAYYTILVIDLSGSQKMLAVLRGILERSQNKSLYPSVVSYKVSHLVVNFKYLFGVTLPLAGLLDFQH